MLDRFYSPTQPGDVLVAVAIAEAATLKEVHHGGFLAGPEQQPVPGGLWGEDIFGDDRWGILTLPIPLLHPAAAPDIARSLGCSVAHVLALARGEAWLSGGQIHLPPGRSLTNGQCAPLWQWPPRLKWPPSADHSTIALAGDLSWRAEALACTGHLALTSLSRAPLVQRVPIPPCTMRPLQVRAGGMRMPGPDNLGFARLVHHRNRLQRMMRLEAPPLLLLQEHRELQLAFEAALTALHQPQPIPEATAVQWRPMGAPRTEPIPLQVMPAPLAPCGAVLRGDHLLLDFPYITTCIHLPTGALIDVWRSTGLTLLGAVGDALVYRHNTSWNHHVFDLGCAQWRHSRPVDIPLPPIPPGDQRFLSACGRFTWRHTPTGREDILDATGTPHLTPWWDDAPHLELPAFSMPGTQPARPPTAMALLADEWRLLDAGILWQGRRPVARVNAWIGAFSEDGERLALVNPERLWLLDVSSKPTMDTEIDLRPLRSLLGSVSGPVLHAALCRYGTLVEVAAADAAELASLEINLDAIGRRRRITADEAGRLLTRARRAAWPDRLPALLLHRGAA
ncbi:MAG: hypothetical protein ACI8RZ_004376 [Myxococcota bacterium]